jgi:hypothetical protein
MKDKYPNDLALPPAITTLQGTASIAGEPLRSPVSGAPCAHWRLRIYEVLAPGMELVHEVIAPEPLEITWQPGPDLPRRTLRMAGDRARIEAQPVLHRAGSPGALATTRHFGLLGRVRGVEEVVVRHGEAVEAEGVLVDPAAAASGPYRAAHGPAELLEATVRLPTGLSIRPALLPWALGTAAALLGAAGVATALSKLWKLHLDASPPAAAEMGPAKVRASVWP